MRIRNSCIALAAVFVLASSSFAGLVEVDLQIAGDKLVTRDTDTNLDWLDITQTVLISFDNMEAMLQPAGAFEDWRRATMFEVDQLFTNAGMLTRGWDNALMPDVTNLLNLAGTTDNNFRIGAQGFTSEAIGLGHHITTHFLSPSGIEPASAYALAINNGSGVNWHAFDGIGHWLVREVPEPASLSLLALGAALIRRRRLAR